MNSRGRPSRIDAVRDELVAYYGAGHTLDECGERFGATPAGIRYALKKYGVGMRKPGTPPKVGPVKGEVIAFYQDGHTLAETGEHFGCAEATVLRTLRLEGVPTRNRGAVPNPGYGGEGWYCPGCKTVVAWDGWCNDRRGIAPGQSLCKSCLAVYRREHYDLETERRHHEAKKPSRRRRNKIRCKELRSEILSHYGGRCACCGVDSYEFLAIDHADGNGSAHRKELKALGVLGGLSYLVWIKKSGFPSFFRLLCHNCNFTRGRYGCCPHEGVAVPPPDTSAMTQPEKENYWRRKAHRKLRKIVLDGYGGSCACCGESTYEFLALDHIGGGGNKAARERRSQGVSQMQWMRRLRREGFPSGLRVLCHNCNSALGWYGRCPHAG